MAQDADTRILRCFGLCYSAAALPRVAQAGTRRTASIAEGQTLRSEVELPAVGVRPATATRAGAEMLVPQHLVLMVLILMIK